MGGLGWGRDGTGVLDSGGMGGLETAMVVLEIGVPETVGTSGLETGMVVLETGRVVPEIGVPDTGGTGGRERETVGREGRYGYVVAESRSGGRGRWQWQGWVGRLGYRACNIGHPGGWCHIQR